MDSNTSSIQRVAADKATMALLNIALVVIMTLTLLPMLVSTQSRNDELVTEAETMTMAMDESNGHNYDSKGPLVQCSYLPLEFLNCSDPEDLKGNTTKRNKQGYGCTEWGGERFEEVQMTSVWCTVLPGIECYGNRTFLRDGFPCIKYNGHYFVSTLLYSVLLGFLGMDRFCLGYTGTAVGKVLTLGGVGIWWIIDVVLLVTGQLKPADKSNWVPYY